jgi:acetyl-CoA synthetase
MVTELGVKKGDRVIIYMPMVPELTIATLACARIGAVHSVVFGGFSAKALRDRIEVTTPAAVLTSDGGYRRGKVIPQKPNVDEALAGLKDMPGFKMPKVIVAYSLEEKDRSSTSMEAGRDVFWADLVKDAPTEWPAEPMDSEDPLFILYSSGSTGKPKGIVHTTGGYMVHAKYSSRVVFDLKDDDVYWCTADVGWITGHTYLVYGPLANAATGVMFEGTPDYPAKDRWWDCIEKHKVSVFYTAPTAIRSFMKWGVEELQKHDLTSIRMLGSVGEPINPEAWRWYYEHVGASKTPISDTWWQTETGGVMVCNLPGITDMKPGSAGLPLPGIEVAVLGEDGVPVKSGGGYLSITKPWPSMLRGLYNDPERYKDSYWSRFDTYFSGDGAMIDEDGYIKVLGRTDDVLNVAGHRIGTMELESALVGCDGVAEAAIVGMPDEIKYEVPLAFVILKEGVDGGDDKRKQLMKAVNQDIGAIARPKYIVFTPELPKTRSGKIMRRILKNLAIGGEIGETSTLANPDIVQVLKEAMMECDPDGFCDVLAEKPKFAEK